MELCLSDSAHAFVKRIVQSRTAPDLNLSQVSDITARTGGMHVSPFALLQQGAIVTPPDHI